MHNNRYTQTLNNIKAPEGAVEKALEMAANHSAEEVRSVNVRSAGRTVSRRKITRWVVAAVLALAVALGALFAPSLLSGKAGRAFTVAVQAAELTKDSPIFVDAGEAAMNLVGKDGGTEYYIALPFAVKGENVVSVTYRTDKDRIAVICPQGSDPVTAGEMVAEGLDTLFDMRYLNQAEKAGSTGNALSRKYSSVTLAAGDQDFVMGLVGTSEKNVSEFYEKNDKMAASNNVLNERAARWNELLSGVIHCTVTFSDGHTQQFDIQLGFTVMNASSANPAAFAELSAEEKAEKDHIGIFVVYSFAE